MTSCRPRLCKHFLHSSRLPRVTALETSITDLDDGTPARPLNGSESTGDDFTGIVLQLRGRIHGWARRLTGDRDEAEDIAQDVLMRLHARVQAAQHPQRMVGWLYRVTHNLVHDHRTLARRRVELLEQFAQHPERFEAGAPQPLPVESLAQLAASYRTTLSAQQRKVFTMVDLEGRSTAEVSALTGIAPSTVRVHLARARRTIRLRMLAEHPDLLEDYKE